MPHLVPRAAAAAVLLLLCVSLVPAARACMSVGASVGAALNPGLETPTLNEDGTYARYGADQVEAHFAQQPGARFRPATGTTFSCVDARGDKQLLGTPGGDLAEIVAAAMAWFKYKNKPVNAADIATIYNAFFSRIASTRRPLYFHTDDSRIRRLFMLMREETGVKPNILPYQAPSNAEVWLKHMVKPEVQGCGHVRLMLSADTAPFYSVKLNNETEVKNCQDLSDGAGCINSADVAAGVISQFFRSWWFTVPNSVNRNKVSFTVDVGPLVGKAVAIVSHSPADVSCKDQGALMYPNFGGSTLFIYHDSAVKSFRAHVTRVALERLGLVATADSERFVELWNAVAGQQLGATLTYLAPANNLGIFPVTIKADNRRGPILGR